MGKKPNTAEKYVLTQFRDESYKPVAPEGREVPPPATEEEVADYKAKLDEGETEKLTKIVQNEIGRRGLITRQGSSVWVKVQREVVGSLLHHHVDLAEIHFDD